MKYIDHDLAPVICVMKQSSFFLTLHSQVGLKCTTRIAIHPRTKTGAVAIFCGQNNIARSNKATWEEIE